MNFQFTEKAEITWGFANELAHSYFDRLSSPSQRLLARAMWGDFKKLIGNSKITIGEVAVAIGNIWNVAALSSDKEEEEG